MSFSLQNSSCVFPLSFQISIKENINGRVVVSVDSIAFSFSQNYGVNIRRKICTLPEAYVKTTILKKLLVTYPFGFFQYHHGNQHTNRCVRGSIIATVQ